MASVAPPVPMPMVATLSYYQSNGLGIWRLTNDEGSSGVLCKSFILV